jgi:four helix bundle protein
MNYLPCLRHGVAPRTPPRVAIFAQVELAGHGVPRDLAGEGVVQTLPSGGKHAAEFHVVAVNPARDVSFEGPPLVRPFYQITSSFPREELYGLTRQLRRACSSIPANLAEGCGRNGDAEFARFCSTAMGSASELEYHLLLARDLKLLKPKDHEELSQRATEAKR